ncbi:MAG TPA: ABC transporter permease [Caulobacteraceae bacterium]|jgi:ABC-2 type transport system permease protein|nr:ABC transporter permease [Caulobacteraceae bacterium]
MNLAMFRVMALELWRDRGALVMAFFLPPLVFLIFSAVFAGSTGENIKLSLAVADTAGTPATARLAQALVHDPTLRAEIVTPQTLAEVRRRVHAGLDDAGLVIRGELTAKGAPILILSDPSRAVAGPLAQARVQQAMVRTMPDVLLERTITDIRPAIGPLTDDQKESLAYAQGELRADLAKGKSRDLRGMFNREDVAGAKKGGGTIVYYAGAVTILFALFSAMHGALTLIDERRSGIADRILAGTAGMGPVVNGKFLFLVGQAAVLAAAVFVTAQVVYGAPVLEHLDLWALTTLAAAVCSAGLALGLVSICSTRDQAQMLSTFVILILAAVGGSMIPRFLMPPWLQQLGWATPHAWVIDAYQGALWRDEGAGQLYKAWLVLGLIGAFGLIVAHLFARRAR